MTRIIYGYARVSTRGQKEERLPMPEQFAELAEDWWNGRITATDAGRLLQVSRKTFIRRAEEWGQAAGLGRRGP